VSRDTLFTPARPLWEFSDKSKLSAEKQPPYQLANLLLGGTKIAEQQRKLIFSYFTAVFLLTFV
jgi:hypothetical protein